MSIEPIQDFEKRISRYMDGQATPEDIQQLNRTLRESPAARALFAEHLNLDSALADMAAGLPGETAAIDDMLALRQAESTWQPWFIGLTTCAAILVLALGTWWGLAGRNYATVVRSLGVTAVIEGSQLGRQPLVITEGTLELVTARGARLVIEAPAEFHFESSQRLNLKRGRLSADIPPAARGFTVVTPTGDAVDLGTRFAIDIANTGESEVHVFEGEVIARAKGSKQRQYMTALKAIRLRDDKQTEECDIRQGTFVSASEVSPLAEALRVGQKERAGAASEQLKQDKALLAWLDFDSSLGQAGIAQPAVIHGTRRVQGRFPGSGALDFVNSDDCVELDLAAHVRQFTLMTWIRPNQFEGRRNSLYSTDEWGQLGQVHWMIGDDNQIRFAIKGTQLSARGDYNHWLETERGTLSELHRWVHLALVYDAEAGEARQYLNGEVVASAQMPQGLEAWLGSAQLGNWKPQPKLSEPRRRLSARLDEFAAFGRALSAAEVRAYYESSSPYK